MSHAPVVLTSVELSGHTIIAGYGIPGRSVAEVLHERGLPYCVLELNPEIVTRCALGHVPIIQGAVQDRDALKRAGIERAAMLCITVPVENAAVEAVSIARELNPKIQILARCHYISAGLEATKRGADEVIVSEQIVAQEFSRVVADRIASQAVVR